MSKQRKAAVIEPPPLYWGADEAHPVGGDLVVKPNSTGYYVSGHCNGCMTRIGIHLVLQNKVSEVVALARALSRHPSPPEPFNPGMPPKGGTP